MTTQPDPGWTLPNRFGRALLIEFERLLGANGLAAVLKLSNLPDWGVSLPADDLERGFRFRDAAALYRGLEQLYGERGARGLIRQANRDAFKHAWKDSAWFAEVFESASTVIPAKEDNPSWNVLARVFNEISDLDFAILAEGESIQAILSHCPDCLGHHSEEACCTGMLGLLEGAHALLHPGISVSIHESECLAAEGTVCAFAITTQVEA